MNKAELPLVSIVIPVFNGEAYLAQTIASACAQNYPALEIIVVDDGSNDGTMSVIEQSARDYPQLQVIRQQNRGAAAARNAGYLRSQGAYLKFLDGDDLIDPDMIRQQVTLAQAHPQSLVSAKWGRFYGDDASTFTLNPEACWQTMDAGDWLCASWRGTQSMTNPGIFLIPRQLLELAGLWDERLSLLDDTEFFSRMMGVARHVVFCQPSTLYYRSGIKGNLSGDTSRRGFESQYAAFERTVKVLLEKGKAADVPQICANIWQLFIYNIYPKHPDLAGKARENSRHLPPPVLRYPAGGKTKFIAHMTGWKFAKLMRMLFK